jgi:hypothetical protein
MNVSHDTLATILRWAYAPSERAAADAIVELAEARRREQQMSRPEAHQWRDDDDEGGDRA